MDKELLEQVFAKSRKLVSLAGTRVYLEVVTSVCDIEDIDRALDLKLAELDKVLED